MRKLLLILFFPYTLFKLIQRERINNKLKSLQQERKQFTATYNGLLKQKATIDKLLR